MAEDYRILLIWEDGDTAGQLKEQLVIQEAYSILAKERGERALEALKQESFNIVILQLGIFNAHAVEFIEEIKKIDEDSIIIVFLNNPDPRAIKDLFKTGIYDLITGPLNPDKLFFLIKKGKELHSLMAANRRLLRGIKEYNIVLEKQNVLLTKRIEESTRNLTRLYEDLRSTYMRTIRALAQAIETRDRYTHSHSQNVARYAVAIAEEMGLSVSEIEILREACELHDLGKIGIEDSILGKPSSLTPEEWAQVKRHPITGAQILEPLTFLGSVIELVREHHEHYDGSGYTEGRRGEDILLGARIIHLADAYDAMRSPRSYRKEPFSKEEAILEIKKNNGTQFDPKVVETFLRIVDKL